MKLKFKSVVAAFVMALALPSVASAQLQWFGYTGGADNEALEGTASYVNFGYFSTDENDTNAAATDRVNAMSQKNMKAILELGKLLWAPGPSGTYRTLYSNFQARWNNWKQANASVLTSDKVLAFLVRDEPFTNQVNIFHFEIACQMVKQDFPWAKIILVEAADIVACPNANCYFNQYRAIVNTVDWIGVDKYAINPVTDTVFRSAVTRMKQSYPGRKFVYVGDGFWDSSHVSAFGSSINAMRNTMTRWYDVARNDPDAVLLGVFNWHKFQGIIAGSREFPPAVLEEHARVGRAITGRVRPQLSQPTGLFEGFDSGFYAVGWACDPDGAWGERILVDIYDGTTLLNTTFAERSSEFFPQCRTGIAHRFRMPLSFAAMGRDVIAYARDLNSGLAQLSSNCPNSPACGWYPNDYAPIGEFRISSTGLAEGWACDPDAPQVSLYIQVHMDNICCATAPNGTVVGVFQANLSSDETINGQCGGGTAHRFSVQLPSWTKGHAIYITAFDTMQGGSMHLITAPNSGCPAVGACIW